MNANGILDNFEDGLSVDEILESYGVDRHAGADMKQFLAIWVFLAVLGHAGGETLQLKGSQLNLPTGNVIGAAID